MMIHTTFAAALAALAVPTASGCAVTRGQEAVGAYVDDTVNGVTSIKNEIAIRP